MTWWPRTVELAEMGVTKTTTLGWGNSIWSVHCLISWWHSTPHGLVSGIMLAVVTIWKDCCWCQSAALMSELNFFLRLPGNCHSLSFRGTSWQESYWSLLMLKRCHVNGLMLHCSCSAFCLWFVSTAMKLLYGRHWHYWCSFRFTVDLVILNLRLAYEFWNVSIMWQCERNVRLHVSFSPPNWILSKPLGHYPLSEVINLPMINHFRALPCKDSSVKKLALFLFDMVGKGAPCYFQVFGCISEISPWSLWQKHVTWGCMM